MCCRKRTQLWLFCEVFGGNVKQKLRPITINRRNSLVFRLSVCIFCIVFWQTKLYNTSTIASTPVSLDNTRGTSSACLSGDIRGRSFGLLRVTLLDSHLLLKNSLKRQENKYMNNLKASISTVRHLLD